MFGVIRDIWHKIAAAHRSADETGAGTVLEFFVPRLKRAFFIRMSVVALLAAVVFGFVLIPCVINGESMVPTFPAHGFTFCWRGKYLFGKPRRGDVVIIRYADKVYFLKRIVGLPGETVDSATRPLYQRAAQTEITCITSAT
uniref:signal peptidase I n=1 Tax=Victivallis vadensis TaxID=172901 RepID=UPI0001572ABC